MYMHPYINDKNYEKSNRVHIRNNCYNPLLVLFHTPRILQPQDYEFIIQINTNHHTYFKCTSNLSVLHWRVSTIWRVAAHTATDSTDTTGQEFKPKPTTSALCSHFTGGTSHTPATGR